MKQTDGRGMFGKGIKRPVKAAQSQTARRRSADLQSAVSRICNPLVAESIRHLRVFGRLAECNSAIRQSATLRYGAGEPSRQELLQRHCSGAAHRPAFTGFRIT